jgi:hypothetical protein
VRVLAQLSRRCFSIQPNRDALSQIFLESFAPL